MCDDDLFLAAICALYTVNVPQRNERPYYDAKIRSCVSDGIMPRTFATRAISISA